MYFIMFCLCYYTCNFSLHRHQAGAELNLKVPFNFLHLLFSVVYLNYTSHLLNLSLQHVQDFMLSMFSAHVQLSCWPLMILNMQPATAVECWFRRSTCVHGTLSCSIQWYTEPTVTWRWPYTRRGRSVLACIICTRPVPYSYHTSSSNAVPVAGSGKY